MPGFRPSQDLPPFSVRRNFRLAFVVITAVVASQNKGIAEESWTVVVRGQSAGNVNRALLLFGEIQESTGPQVGSYFEKFEPTQVDPTTGAPLAGKGESLFRLAGGTIATENTSRVVGPGPQPNTLQVETAGRVVKGTGDFAGLAGTIQSRSIITATFDFEANVVFRVSGGKTTSYIPGPTCTDSVIPVRCCRPTPNSSCCRVPRLIRLPTCFRLFICR